MRKDGKIFLSAYHSELVWGGPEEGGWWWTRSDKLETKVIKPEDYEMTEKEFYEKYPDDGRPISSVLSTGKTTVCEERYPGEFQTKKVPHYE